MSGDIILKRTRPNVIKLLYNLSYTVHQIFEANDLEYWASGGSFLGLVRHRGIIPWDDDCDLCVYDEKKFLSLVPQLNKCGLIITDVYFGYKIMFENIPFTEASGYSYSFPNVDIFIMRLVKKTPRPYYDLKYTEGRNDWPNEKYYIDEHYPLVKYPFGDGVMLGTNNFKAYLDRMFGKTWNKIAYREADHEIEETLEKIIVKLTPADRAPAQPIPKYTKRKCVSARRVSRRASRRVSRRSGKPKGRPRGSRNRRRRVRSRK